MNVLFAVLIIGAGTALIAAIGFIGNLIFDGLSNSLRHKSEEEIRRETEATPYTRLADRR
ncbi:MAG: hypothetical protein J5562_01165 [Clostridia bacterium]|nr:hypothetical protein [Clostridia bacterium]